MTLKLTGALAALAIATTAHATDLRFGTDAAYPPYEYKLPDGRLAGLDIDIGNALCAAARVKCVWVENSFDGMIAGLQSRKFDAINSALAATDARRAVMDFTAPLYPADIRLVAKKGSGLRPDAKSLAGRHVGVLQGSVQAAFAKANWAKNGVAVDEYADQNAVYADLANGRLDATLVLGAAARSGFLDKPQGANFELTGPRVDDPAIRAAGAVIGVRKNDAKTRDMLDAALKQLRDDGTIDRLMQKHLGDVRTSN